MHKLFDSAILLQGIYPIDILKQTGKGKYERMFTITLLVLSNDRNWLSKLQSIVTVVECSRSMSTEVERSLRLSLKMFSNVLLLSSLPTQGRIALSYSL